MPNDKLDTLLEHVAQIKTDLADVKSDVTEIKETVNAHTEALDGLARAVKILQDEKTMRDKTIARLDFRTEKLLGKKLHAVDAEFEDQYPRARR